MRMCKMFHNLRKAQNGVRINKSLSLGHAHQNLLGG